MKKDFNPFIIKGYFSKALFCNRKAELETLNRNLENGSNTTLISPRKMGKSGLIFRFFDELKTNKEVECIYVDIYSSRSLNDFISLVSEAITHKFSEKTATGAKFMKFLKGVRPLISFDPLTGAPQIQINFQTEDEKKYTLHGLFEFLEKQEKTILLAIDEFQQINEYPEENTESLLRTYIQPLKNVFFIFCGSNQHIMIKMFTIANRPFFASTRMLFLDKIEKTEYTGFIKMQFKKNGKSISDDALNMIADWTKLHTFYTQNLCNSIFAMKIDNIHVDEIKKAMFDLLKENETYFYQYRQFLTAPQWNYLIAIAKEGEITQVTAQNFINKHNIGTPANSRRLLKSLIEKELILEVQKKDTTRYQIYDVFFMRWLQITY